MVMARIYINCGYYEEAVDELDNLLSLETKYTANNLKLWSWVDPFRDHPRFKALMQKYSNL
jgi:hypothetical protein